MLIFLPTKVDGLSDLEKNLPKLGVGLINIFESGPVRKINVTLPKFKLKKENGFNLISSFEKLGLGNIFNDKKGDFAEMSRMQHSDPCVHHLAHIILVKMNEWGCEVSVKEKSASEPSDDLPAPVTKVNKYGKTDCTCFVLPKTGTKKIKNRLELVTPVKIDEDILSRKETVTRSNSPCMNEDLNLKIVQVRSLAECREINPIANGVESSDGRMNFAVPHKSNGCTERGVITRLTKTDKGVCMIDPIVIEQTADLMMKKDEESTASESVFKKMKLSPSPCQDKVEEDRGVPLPVDDVRELRAELSSEKENTLTKSGGDQMKAVTGMNDTEYMKREITKPFDEQTDMVIPQSNGNTVKREVIFRYPRTDTVKQTADTVLMKENGNFCNKFKSSSSPCQYKVEEDPGVPLSVHHLLHEKENTPAEFRADQIKAVTPESVVMDQKTESISSIISCSEIERIECSEGEISNIETVEVEKDVASILTVTEEQMETESIEMNGVPIQEPSVGKENTNSLLEAGNNDHKLIANVGDTSECSEDEKQTLSDSCRGQTEGKATEANIMFPAWDDPVDLPDESLATQEVPYDFTGDHPFIFCIVGDSICLVIGKVQHPPDEFLDRCYHCNNGI